jgi:hypothetical protein
MGETSGTASLSPRAVGGILPVVTNRCDADTARKNPEQKMDGKPLQIATPPTSGVKVMPRGKLSGVFYGFGKLDPE